MIEFINIPSTPYPDNMAPTVVKINGNKVYLDLKAADRKARRIGISDNIFQLDNNVELVGVDIEFSSSSGYYVMTPSGVQNIENLILGRGKFPYTFAREYEAVKHLKLFTEMAELTPAKLLKIQPLNHTLGVEFETSSGYMPQEICFKNGLIPLRDGSIGACEYSSIILSGASGLDLLRKEADALKKYTVFDKECALHMHLGGFPLSSKAIFTLYVICFYLEHSNYFNMIPRLSFRTSEYKANGKDYCLKLPEFHSFLDLYKFFVRRDYGGSLSQPHPEDPDRNHKWQIHNRYYGLNLINMLCYKSPKTVEFRFLRPSFNWIKLFFWAYFFDMIVTLAEKLQSRVANKEFTNIFDYTYKYMRGADIEMLIDDYTDRASLREFMKGVSCANCSVVESQHSVGDYCGERTDIEDVILNRWFEESGINLEK